MIQDQTRALVERLRAPTQLGQYKALKLEAADHIDRQSRIIVEKDAEIERLRRALFFWMPGADLRLDGATFERVGEDAGLLAGYSGALDEPCWGDSILARALAAESSRDAAVKDAYEDAARIALETPMGMENHPQKIAAAIRSRAQTAREDGAGK